MNMVEVALIVLALVALIEAAYIVLLLGQARKVKGEVARVAGQLAKLEGDVKRHQKSIERTEHALIARRRPAEGASLVPALDAAMTMKSRGMVPTILLIGWRLLSAYRQRKENAGGPANVNP